MMCREMVPHNTPRDEDCGPGFGEIDHYKLLGLVAFTGRTIPLLLREYLRPAPASARLRRRDRRPCAHCSRVPRAHDPRASEHAASLMRARVEKKALEGFGHTHSLWINRWFRNSSLGKGCSDDD